MNDVLIFFLVIFAPSVLTVVVAIVLSLFGKPPKKKYWGPGESWWPDEDQW